MQISLLSRAREIAELRRSREATRAMSPSREVGEALRGSSATSLAEEVRKFKRDMLARRNIRVERVDRDWFGDSSHPPSSENTPRVPEPRKFRVPPRNEVRISALSPSPPPEPRRVLPRRKPSPPPQFEPASTRTTPAPPVVVHCPCLQTCPCGTLPRAAASAPCSARPARTKSPDLVRRASELRGAMRSAAVSPRSPARPQSPECGGHYRGAVSPRKSDGTRSVGVQTVFVQTKVGELEREIARLRRENVRLTSVANRLRWESAAAASHRGGLASTRFFGVI
jgi:hypothetical protein